MGVFWCPSIREYMRYTYGSIEIRIEVCTMYSSNPYMPTSVKRIAGQSFKFSWTHTNSAGHTCSTFIRTDSIKKLDFSPFLGVLAGHCC